MTREERVKKLRSLITCMKCEVSGKACDDNCPTQYNAGNMGEIIENLEEIAKALEQEPSEDMTIAYLMGLYADKKPCEDAISRTDLIRKLQAWDAKANGIPNYAWGIIKELPSVTPKGKDYSDCGARMESEE